MGPVWIVLVLLQGMAVTAYVLLIRRKTAMLKASSVFSPPENYMPSQSITVLIPVKNHADRLADCLQSIINQQFPDHLLQVVVVDDGAGIDLLPLIKKIFSDRPDVQFRCIQNKGRGKKQAIASGMECASGEILVLTDADCLHETEWLLHVESAFFMGDFQLLIGPVEKTGSGLVAELDRTDYAGMMLWGLASLLEQKPVLASSCNLACKKKAFVETNPYAPNASVASGDDMFLLHSIVETFGEEKVACVFSPQAIVRTQACSSWNEYIHSRIRWGGKTRYYLHTRTARLAFVVASFHLLMLLILAGAFFIPLLWPVLVISLLAKYFFDKQLFRAGMKKPGYHLSLNRLFLFECMQCFLVPYLVIRSAFSDTGKW